MSGHRVLAGIGLILVFLLSGLSPLLHGTDQARLYAQESTDEPAPATPQSPPDQSRPTSTAAPSGDTIPTQGDCNRVPSVPLVIGEQAQILPGSPGDLLLEPDFNSAFLASILPADRLLVMEGPVCVAGVNWWQVSHSGLVGWTPANLNQQRVLEPIPPTQRDYQFGGVSFTLDSRISELVVGQVFPPAHLDDPELAFTLRAPGFINFALDTNFDNPGVLAQFAVYPALAFGEMQQTTALIDLADILLNRLMDPFPPALPAVGAERVLVGKRVYLEFDGGTGMRFIAHYSASADPLTSSSLYYVFLGLTTGSEQYIQFYYPLTTSLFPSVIPPDFDYNQFVLTYPTYIDQAQQALSSAQVTSFSPPLATLDALITSIRLDMVGVAATLNGDTSLTARCELIAFVDTRLRVDPNVDAVIADYLPAAVPVEADGQYIVQGVEFPWWRIAPAAYEDLAPLPGVASIDGERWIRADFTEEVGDCSNLPLVNRGTR